MPQVTWSQYVPQVTWAIGGGCNISTKNERVFIICSIGGLLAHLVDVLHHQVYFHFSFTLCFHFSVTVPWNSYSHQILTIRALLTHGCFIYLLCVGALHYKFVCITYYLFSFIVLFWQLFCSLLTVLLNSNVIIKKEP